MRHRGHIRYPAVARLALVVGACLALVVLVAGLAATAPHASAASADDDTPVIHWDASMKISGVVGGPVGEHVQVHGEHFTAYASQTLRLQLVPGDIDSGMDSTYEQCKLKDKVDLGTVDVDNSGHLDFNFDWPAAANHGQYSICAYTTTDGLPVSPANQDDGPFTVLGSGRPGISLASASVAAGSSVIVTGKNWVPAQKVHVYVGSCSFCDAPPLAQQSVTSQGNDTGTFSVKITLPAKTPPGEYPVLAVSENGLLDAGTDGARTITVGTAATPTTAPTATGVATATSAAAGGGPGGGDNGNGMGRGVGALVLVVLGIVVIALFALVIVFLLIVLARRQSRPPPQPSQLPQSPQPPRPASYAPQSYPPPGYQQPSYPQPSYPQVPQSYPGQPYVAPDWREMPRNWTAGNTAAYPFGPPMGDDSPTRPGLFPLDADAANTNTAATYPVLDDGSPWGTPPLPPTPPAPSAPSAPPPSAPSVPPATPDDPTTRRG